MSLLFIFSGLLIASRFYPKLEQVQVFGNEHYSAEEIMRLAKSEPGAPFFWITRSRVSDLKLSPWIQNAVVYRHWPDTLSITVEERKPAFSDGFMSYALDGTALPGLTKPEQDALIQVSGWGEPRFEEVLTLLNDLADFGPKVLSYSPAGFQIQLAESQLSTPSAALLQENWASFLSQQGTHAYVYPWGVSTAHD